jgi:PKD repeat protein
VDGTITFQMQADDSPNDLPVLNYSWEMDGGIIVGSEIEHVFTTGGTKTVKGTVTDDDGASDEVSFTIMVDNPAPTAFITANRTEVLEGESVMFTANATDNPSDLDSLVFFWDFGDGKEALGTTEEERMFPREGTYTVKVFVQDDERARGMAYVDITVKKAPAKPDDDDDDDDAEEEEKDNTVMFAAIAVIILLVAIAIVVIVFMVTRKKGKEEEKERETEAPPEEEEAPVEDEKLVEKGEAKKKKGKKKGKKRKKGPEVPEGEVEEVEKDPIPEEDVPEDTGAETEDMPPDDIPEMEGPVADSEEGGEVAVEEHVEGLQDGKEDDDA